MRIAQSSDFQSPSRLGIQLKNFFFYNHYKSNIIKFSGSRLLQPLPKMSTMRQVLKLRKTR